MSAKIDLKFLDLHRNYSFISVTKKETETENFIQIELYDLDTSRYNCINLDIFNN